MAQCHVCGIPFTGSMGDRQFNRQRHMRLHEETEKAFNCSLPCKYSTDSRYHFERHREGGTCLRCESKSLGGNFYISIPFQRPGSQLPPLWCQCWQGEQAQCAPERSCLSLPISLWFRRMSGKVPNQNPCQKSQERSTRLECIFEI